MKPILFDKNANNFTTNGLGRLDCISCVVTEERNGAYELEMSISMSSNHASEIVLQSIIGAIPFDGGTIQAFRVYEISKPINGKFKVYARHISYDLSKIPAMPFTITSSPTACADTLAGLKSHAVETCPFTFWTDLTTAAGYKQIVPASIRSRLGGVEGSVLDQFGGEYEFDNYSVKLHKQRGRLNTGITLRYGKNITDINQEENIANTVTGICPYWSDMEGENVVTLPENVVYSQYASSYPFHLTEVHDFSELFENEPSVSSLRSAAQAYVNRVKLGIPKVNIEVSFVALWQTEEYKDIAPLERVKMCDEITVVFDKLGISDTAKVVKTVYDVLAEKYISIQVGEIRTSLAQALTDKDMETITAISAGNLKTYREANATAVDAINNATAWLTGSNGYVCAVKNADGTWKELLFMDTNNTSTARNVLRINTNGLGFSTTGIDGPYTNAWTIDGNLVASFIKTGILSDLAGKFSLDMTNGTLSMADGTFSGTINSSTINGSTINGATVNIGNYQNVDGILNIYNNNGTLVGSWTKTGLTLYKDDGTTVRLEITASNGLVSYGKSKGGTHTYKAVYGFSGETDETLSNRRWNSNAIAYYKDSSNMPMAKVGLFFTQQDNDDVYNPRFGLHSKDTISIEALNQARIYGTNSVYIIADSSDLTFECSELNITADHIYYNGQEVHFAP